MLHSISGEYTPEVREILGSAGIELDYNEGAVT